MLNQKLENDYARPFIGIGYDLLSRSVFGAVGGLEALRDRALEHFAIAPGTRVLELGCGTGGITRKLLARGAQVTAVDWSAPMLQRARARAPGAVFHRAELTAYEPREVVDVVLFGFVLHELDRAARAEALGVAARALGSRAGRLAILDFALPQQGLLPRALSAVVVGFEPGSIADWMLGMDEEVRSAGFAPEPHVSLAGGLATAFCAARRDGQ